MRVTVKFKRNGEPWRSGYATYSAGYARKMIRDAIRSGHARCDIYLIEPAPCRLTDADRERLAGLRKRKTQQADIPLGG